MTKELEDRLRKLEGELRGLRQETGQQTEPTIAKERSTSGRRKSRRALWFWLTGIIILCTLAAGSILVWRHAHQSKSPLASYAQKTNFPLYYPTFIPDGYALADNSVKASPQLVSYTLSAQGKPSVTVTLQPVPSGFDASAIIGKNPIPTQGIPIGSLYDISTGQQSKYFVTTGNGTLVFINSSGKAKKSFINALAQSLQEVN